jgi:putative hydrolase of the HAD superfamily
MPAITFDVGQCLLSFDASFFAEKLASRGLVADPLAMDAAVPDAFLAYGAMLKTGGHGAGAWKHFLRVVMSAVNLAPTEELLEWLYVDQAHRNLWRRPVPGIIDIARDLRREGLPVGIVSNSEGHLDKLLAQLGYTDDFPVVADSGVLGFEKPGPQIFGWAADKLGVKVTELIHIGDSWAADIEGAIGVGAKAIWFPAVDDRALPSRVLAARSAGDVRVALARFRSET